MSKLIKQFENAPQIIVTLPTQLEELRANEGWLSARKYPEFLKPGKDERGMIVEGGQIKKRIFHA